MFVQLQLAAQHTGGPQLQHRHLISRGSSEGTTGQSHPASGSASGMARVSHNPQPHHTHPHHPNTMLPSNPVAFPPSPSIPSVPPMYPTSASGHCSPPPHPSQLPGSSLHSQQPSSACPNSPSSPSLAASCPEVSHFVLPYPIIYFEKNGDKLHLPIRLVRCADYTCSWPLAHILHRPTAQQRCLAIVILPRDPASQGLSSKVLWTMLLESFLEHFQVQLLNKFNIWLLRIQQLYLY